MLHYRADGHRCWNCFLADKRQYKKGWLVTDSYYGLTLVWTLRLRLVGFWAVQRGVHSEGSVTGIPGWPSLCVRSCRVDFSIIFVSPPNLPLPPLISCYLLPLPIAACYIFDIISLSVVFLLPSNTSKNFPVLVHDISTSPPLPLLRHGFCTAGMGGSVVGVGE